MPDDDEVRIAKLNARVEKLAEAERILIREANDDESFQRDILAKYDAALEARDESGIAAYLSEVEKLRNRHTARTAALTRVRAEYDALERQRSLRPQHDAVAGDMEVRRRAIDFIVENWGTLRDMPPAVVPVVWVTVYCAIEVGLRAERNGGAPALVKDTLAGGTLGREVQEATLSIQFLQRYLPILREEAGRAARRANAQLLIDILKWNITDAPYMSRLARTLARTFAKANTAYKRPVPHEICQ